jgi:hypothetical protein
MRLGPTLPQAQRKEKAIKKPACAQGSAAGYMVL